MKHCPKCQNRFTDEGLKYCRFDGLQLVGEVVAFDEAPTLLFINTPKDVDAPDTPITGPLIRS